MASPALPCLYPADDRLPASFEPSADPQMHSWRDWKQRMTVVVSF